MNKSKNRTIYQVNKILKRRYDCGDTLLELFIDHECIHTLETLISYGPDETGGENSETWQEYKNLTDNFLIDLEAGRFGAYSNFIDQAASCNIDGRKAFNLFADASSYYGLDIPAHDELERGAEMAACFEERGKIYLNKLRNK